MTVSVREWGEEVQTTLRETLKKAQKIIDAVNIDDIKVENCNDYYKLSNSISSLAKTLAEVSRENRERSALIDEVVHVMKVEIKGLLEHRPDLMEQVQDAIDEAHGIQLARIESGDDGIQSVDEHQTVGQRYRVRIKNERKKSTNTKLITK